LVFSENYLCTQNKKYPIAKFSQKGTLEIIDACRKGYKIKGAEIRYLVYWKDKNDDQECLVVLPDVHLELDLDNQKN
jgi:hypothetical protein